MLILFVSMQGSFILNYFGVQKHKETEKKSRKKNISLSFTTSAWHNVEKVNEDEIRIHGQMFDVKSVQIQENKIIVFGHYDDKEDELIANVKNMEKKKGEHKKNTNIDNTLFFEDVKGSLANIYTVFHDRDYPLLSQIYFFQYHKIENPPPKHLA